MFCSKEAMLGTSKSISGFDPRSIGSCQLWLDAADVGTMNSTPTVTQWNDKSGNGSNVVGTATYSGGTMTFNGTNQAFSNTGFVFPSNAYSMFAVYSNTTAPAAGGYMNAVYGNGGYPMLGTYDTGKYVSARSVATNTGALGQTATATANGWAAQIAATGNDVGYGVATDLSGNVFVIGYYDTALTLFNTGGGTGATLPLTGGNDCFLAKYSSAGSVIWAAQIAGATTSSDQGQSVATDLSGNVFVTGYYSAACTLYNTGGGTGATLPFTGGGDVFLAKYSSTGSVIWAARMTGPLTSDERGQVVATDSSGNVFVTGYYNSALTLYNTGGTAGVTLAFTGGVADVFLAKYSSAGSVVWAAQIAGSGEDKGWGVATDSSGNVFVSGYYGAALTLYNTGGTTGATLALTGGADVFLAKYSSTGSVVWAAQIAGSGAVTDLGYGVATDSSGNVFVTGYYGAACTLYNTGGGTGATLPLTSGNDVFLAKYSPAGSVIWATRIATSSSEVGYAVATDSIGNVLVTGYYGAALLTLYNTPGIASGATLPFTGNNDAFLAKYSSAGSVVWATRIAGALTSDDRVYGVATDSSGNVFVTGQYRAALTLYDTDGGTSTTLPFTGGIDVFLAKYSSAGFITGTTTIYSDFFSASSTTLVSAIYTPSTVSPFVNGTTFQTITGTTAAATGLFIGGPSNYFNGSLSELLIYASTLSTTQRQAVEGYLTWKWNLRSSFLVSHPLYATPPFMKAFTPIDITGCRLWMDAADTSTMNSSTTVTSWSDKSGSNNTMVGTATYSGGTMTFNGAQAFSNTGFVFPNTAYSMFAVYSNTTAPAAAAYMNVVYGNGGYPMLGTFDTTKDVTARSVVANTGVVNLAGGWATRIAGTATSTYSGQGVATDSSGNVFVTGYYDTACTLYNTGGGTGATLALTGGQDAFLAKYSSAGSVIWAAQIAGATTGNETGQAVATDSIGNVFVTGQYTTALTLYNTGGGTGATLPFTGGSDVFLAKYSSTGSVVWAAQISASGTQFDVGYGVATDSIGNVLVTGYYGAACTLYNTGGGTGATLTFSGGQDVFLAKYSSAGSVLWATRITATIISADRGYGVATDSSRNVFVTGQYTAALTLYNTPGIASGATLPFTGGVDGFLAKYSLTGSVVWAAQITGTTTANDVGYGVATDLSGNVFVTGYYSAACTLYNTGGGTGATLPFTGGSDVFLAKYSSTGSVVWAAQIAGATTGNDIGWGVATDSSGNVLVTGYYSAACTLYNTGGTTGATLTNAGGNDAFLAKYSSAGSVVWATRIAGSANDSGLGVATDSSGNVFVTGYYNSALTLYNTGGGTGATLALTGVTNVFLAKYSPNGFILQTVPASSNVLVGGTYTPSTFSPFINGSNAVGLSGTTAAATGLFIGGPSNYFNGSLSELLIYAATLTTAQRQQLEGYLAAKWGLNSSLISTQPYKTYAFPITTTVSSNFTIS